MAPEQKDLAAITARPHLIFPKRVEMTATVDTNFDLRSARLESRRSVPELASLLGVHSNTIFRWERRERRPGSQQITTLAAAIEVDRSDVSEYFFRGLGPIRSTGHSGSSLRVLRRKSQVPASALAIAVGVPLHTVYNWEGGRARIPEDRIPSLAGCLSMDAPELVAFLRLNAGFRPP